MFASILSGKIVRVSICGCLLPCWVLLQMQRAFCSVVLVFANQYPVLAVKDVFLNTTKSVFSNTAKVAAAMCGYLAPFVCELLAYYDLATGSTSELKLLSYARRHTYTRFCQMNLRLPACILCLNQELAVVHLTNITCLSFLMQHDLWKSIHPVKHAMN